MSKSDALENAVLDHFLGVSSQTFEASLEVALFSSDPGEGTGGSELSGNGYARQAVAFIAAVSGSTSNDALITFTPSGGDWLQATHAVIFVVGGARRYHAALTTPRTGVDGEPLTFPIGSIVITED